MADRWTEYVGGNLTSVVTPAEDTQYLYSVVVIALKLPLRETQHQINPRPAPTCVCTNQYNNTDQ